MARLVSVTLKDTTEPDTGERFVGLIVKDAETLKLIEIYNVLDIKTLSNNTATVDITDLVIALVMY